MLPIERPQKIVCVGLNYRDHAEEQGVALPERPLLFAKWPNTLIGPVLTHPRADNTEQQVVDKTPGSTQPVSGRQPRPKKPTARSVVTPMP